MRTSVFPQATTNLCYRITDVAEKLRNKSPPVALNTVDMLRVASSQLHMGPQHVMHLAEKLYTQVCGFSVS